ncbi:MAG: membrane protein insertion efficiency factor YidD [Mariprofundales bacterium]|nr:membrane protein insertion efficiency factor YidD [Mariprofundales bacterium]
MPARLLLVLIAVYRYGISPLIGPRCRFYPTCSHYAGDAIRNHGAVRGGWLALRRLLRCHPWSAGGVDWVPQPQPSDHHSSHRTATLARCDHR